MQQASKKQRITKESTISDIAKAIQNTSTTLASISKTHKILLQSNKIIVQYLLEEKQKRLAHEKEAEQSEQSEASNNQDTQQGTQEPTEETQNTP